MRFSEILLIATLVTGLIWVLDAIFLRPRRMMYVLPGRSKEGIKEPWWAEYSRAFFPILLIVFLIRSFLVEPFRIPSGSMRPMLLEGDFIAVNKYCYGLRVPITGTRMLDFDHSELKRGDVIVFKHIKGGDSIDMIKRVIGLPGDHIQYKDQNLYINDKPVPKEFVKEKEDINPHGKSEVREYIENLGNISHEIYEHPGHDPFTAHYNYTDVIVPSGQYYVLGDNRDNSEDSRVWGFVKDEDVQGRAFAIWMSWDGQDNTIRWNRIFRGIQ